MDTGTMSAINRRDARLIAEFQDATDAELTFGGDWYESSLADVLMTTGDATAADRAWAVGLLASSTPGLYFDGEPAGCDWEDLYSHIRAEILARRAPKPPSVCAPEMTVRAGVV